MTLDELIEKFDKGELPEDQKTFAYTYPDNENIYWISRFMLEQYSTYMKLRRERLTKILFPHDQS